MAADGSRMVDPGGNSTTKSRSHSTKCPPLVGSNSPSAVMQHHPKGRLAKSRCFTVQVLGPKLKAAAAQMLLSKFRRRSAFDWSSGLKCSA